MRHGPVSVLVVALLCIALPLTTQAQGRASDATKENGATWVVTNSDGTASTCHFGGAGSECLPGVYATWPYCTSSDVLRQLGFGFSGEMASSGVDI